MNVRKGDNSIVSNNNNNNNTMNSIISSREALMATPPIHLPVNPLHEYAR